MIRWNDIKRPGGGLPYEKGGDARREFWIKHLEEINSGLAQPFLDR